MNRVILGVGSNIDPAENIARARARLEALVQFDSASAFVETRPVGITDQAPFLNGAFAIRTPHDRPALVALLKTVEDELKRDRSVPKFGPRTIDLDVVVWNGKIVDSDVREREFLRNAVRELCPEALDE